MKLDIGKEWCIRMARIEGDAEIGAGRLAVDPAFDGETVPESDSHCRDPGLSPADTTPRCDTEGIASSALPSGPEADTARRELAGEETPLARGT